MVIYKYPLSISEVNHLPAGRLLDIQIQRNQITAWVALDNDYPDIFLKAFPTGASPGPANLEYAKSVQLNNFVWHFFYV